MHVINLDFAQLMLHQSVHNPTVFLNFHDIVNIFLYLLATVQQLVFFNSSILVYGHIKDIKNY